MAAATEFVCVTYKPEGAKNLGVIMSPSRA